MIKHKRLGHTILLLFVVIASALLFFDPFKIERLAEKEDIYQLNMYKYVFPPGGGVEWVGEVHINDPEEISKIHENLSGYLFWRNHFRQPQRKFRSYSKEVAIIRVDFFLNNKRSFSFEITDSAYNNILDFNKRSFAAGGSDYSIGLPKDKQQAELYNTLDAFIMENNESIAAEISADG